jgi:hypothetical protein
MILFSNNIIFSPTSHCASMIDKAVFFQINYYDGGSYGIVGLRQAEWATGIIEPLKLFSFYT